MSKIDNELTGRVEEQIRLLSVLGDCYDQGNEIVALSIAVAICVPVHDTLRSKSLLTYIGAKSGRYLTTNFRDARYSVHLGLVRRINVGSNEVIERSPLPAAQIYDLPAPTFYGPRKLFNSGDHAPDWRKI